MLISIVVPCHNEEENIEILYSRICNIIPGNSDFEIIYVNDASTDGTIRKLRELRSRDSRVHFLDFSRSFGHQIALRAGIDYASGDVVVMLDGDLQHPPELIPTMLASFNEGNEIVNMIREDKPAFTAKYITSFLFYRLLNLLSPTQVTEGGSDFRLMSRRAADTLRRSRERDIFIRGIIPTLGFQQVNIPYEPSERLHGTSTYNPKKMLHLARAGVLSTTVRPLRVSTVIGIMFSFVLLAYLVFVLAASIFSTETAPGWSSLMTVVLLTSALNFLALGVMGEYIAKLVEESRERPLYILKDRTKHSGTDHLHSGKHPYSGTDQHAPDDRDGSGGFAP